MSLKSTELQEQINSLDLAIQQGSTDAQLNLWEMQRKELNDQLQVALSEEAEQQERIDAQAEKVDSITLPFDYNDLLGHPDANETIIENVKQFQLQAYEEHNAEVARINAENKSNLDALYKRHEEVTEQFINDKNDLQRRLDAENEQAKKDAAEITDLIQRVAQLGLEKQEAEQGRDNAAQLLAEANAELENYKQATIENIDLKAQIEALKQELTAKKALTVSGNEKLAELAAKAKESTAAAAQRGIDRWNQQYGMEIPVLEVPEIQPVNAVTETESTTKEETFRSEEVQTSDNGTNTETTGNTHLVTMVGKESKVETIEETIWRLDCAESMMHEWVLELAGRINDLDGKGIRLPDVEDAA